MQEETQSDVKVEEEEEDDDRCKICYKTRIIKKLQFAKCSHTDFCLGCC